MLTKMAQASKRWRVPVTSKDGKINAVFVATTRKDAMRMAEVLVAELRRVGIQAQAGKPIRVAAPK
jgi:hypothetical protein